MKSLKFHNNTKRKLKKWLSLTGMITTLIVPASAISILSVVSCSNSAPNQSTGGGSTR